MSSHEEIGLLREEMERRFDRVDAEMKEIRSEISDLRQELTDRLFGNGTEGLVVRVDRLEQFVKNAKKGVAAIVAAFGGIISHLAGVWGQ